MHSQVELTRDAVRRRVIEVIGAARRVEAVASASGFAPAKPGSRR